MIVITDISYKQNASCQLINTFNNNLKFLIDFDIS